MNIYTFGYTATTAPLSIESIGSAVTTYSTTVKKFGISFTRETTTQDFKYNNNYYFDINSEMMDEFLYNIGITKDTSINSRSSQSILIDLKLSNNFHINDPRSWTILDYIIVYEFSRNVSNNAFEGLTFEDLKNGFLYELESENTGGSVKVVLNINGNRYNLSRWLLNVSDETVEVNDNLFTSKIIIKKDK